MNKQRDVRRPGWGPKGTAEMFPDTQAPFAKHPHPGRMQPPGVPVAVSAWPEAWLWTHPPMLTATSNVGSLSGLSGGRTVSILYTWKPSRDVWLWNYYLRIPSESVVIECRLHRHEYTWKTRQLW